MNPTETEKEILLDLADGNEQAFEKIYTAYSPRLFGRLLKIVKSDLHAREILQDVFLIVWERRKMIDPERSFRSFIFKVTENKAYDFLRKAAKDRNLEEQLIVLASEDYTFIEAHKIDDEHLSILQKSIEDLPPQRQLIFRLCKLEGKSYKEVSELLNVSVSTISDHIVKGTKFIRDYFEKNNLH